MRCEDCRAGLIEGYATEAMEQHLAGCADCRRLRPVLDAGLQRLDDPALWDEASPELEDRVVALIAGTHPGAEPQRHGRTRTRIVAIAAAVAAAAVVVSALAWTGLRAPAPDWEVAISGTNLAPQAGGVVHGWNTGGGTRVALDVSGLDPAPPGYFYEVWFSRDKIHVSAGTFTSTDDVEMTVAVARRDYPRIWVTREPTDTDETPSGITVLDTG